MKIETYEFCGESLEAIGIPKNGTAIIAIGMKPKVFDVVWCDNTIGTISGFFGEIVQTGFHPIVRTRYKDPKKDYQFYAPSIYGVVLGVIDETGKIVWILHRHDPTKVDNIRGIMNDEELAAFLNDVQNGFMPKDCSGCMIFGKNCKQCWLEWLHEPV